MTNQTQTTNEMPRTTGRWEPIVRGRNGSNPRTVAYIETFRTGCGTWVTLPGVSRYVNVR